MIIKGQFQEKTGGPRRRWTDDVEDWTNFANSRMHKSGQKRK